MEKYFDSKIFWKYFSLLFIFMISGCFLPEPWYSDLDLFPQVEHIDFLCIDLN